MTKKVTDKSKILALILGLTMCLALMLGLVFASPTNTAYAAGGTGTTGGLTIGGESDMSGVGYSYKSATQTLTLNGYNGKEIDFSGKTIQVEGNNTITVDKTSKKFGSSSYPYYAGIDSRGAITIAGSGSLAINVETSDVKESCYGIGVENGMTINGGNISININSFYDQQSIGLFSSQGSIKVEGDATLDIKAKTGAMKTSNGDIILSGTKEKKILTNVSEDTWRGYGINAKNGVIDISGSGKVTVDFINGGASWGIRSEESAIKIHDNANVEVNGAFLGLCSQYFYNLPANHTGIEITDSTVKIMSSVDNSGTAAFLASGNQKITIKNSVVTAESREKVFSCGREATLELLGSSTVYFKGSYPAIRDSENHIFDLATGGSITFASTFYTVPICAKLGTNTSVEAGTKGDEVTAGAGIFKYDPFAKYGLRLWRFVYGDTTVASAVADDVTISGITDAALTEQDVKLTLTGDNFKAIAKDTDVTAWFRNMPKGLVAKAKADVAAGTTEMTITISGTPTEAKSESLWIEIPVGKLKTTNYGMTVGFENAEYDIVSGTPVDCPEGIKGLVFNKSEQNGIPANEAYTVQNGRAINAGKYTAKLILKIGYKWSDGTTEDKMVEWEIARRPIEVELTIEKDKYEYTGYAITPSHTVKDKGSLSVLETREYSVSYEHNKEIGWATMTVSDKDGGNYQITVSVSKKFEIVKGTKTPPTGLQGVAPSADGAMDGKITGTTTDMEYSTDTAFTSHKPCTDTETIGLAEGTYYVRFTATATTEASNYVAVHVRLNTVTVVDGDGSKVTKHKSGTSVTVTVTIPTGKSFIKWVYEGVTIPTADVTKQEITFTMPEKDVKLTALFKDIDYNITVTDGTSSAPTAKYQDEVTVKANEPAPDMYFDKWEVTGLDTTGMDLTKTEIKFQMPAGNVTFKATYRAIEKFEIEMVDGTKDKEVAKAGETITITANPAPTGKVFDKWTCETPGVTIVFESATSSTTTFVMPASNIKIQAHFRAVDDKPSVEIKVEGGTGAGTYTQGESATVTAEDKEGKEFVGWQDESGKIVSTNKSYTFTVTEATTLTAVYEDKSSGGGEITPPAKKDGLSGGAIAGIVIGSVAVAGIGGFAIFWFAVKKKTFADLGVALKKGFTTMGNGIKTACRAIGNFFKNLGAKIKSLFSKKK